MICDICGKNGNLRPGTTIKTESNFYCSKFCEEMHLQEMQTDEIRQGE